VVTAHADDGTEAEDEAWALTQAIGGHWRELRRGASMRPLLEHLFGHGPERLDLGQSDTLDVLVQRDGWRMCELADALRVDASSATRAVARLHDEGLVTRRPSATDGRVVVVDATPAGRHRQAAVARRRREAVSTMLADFSLDDRRRLATLLGRLVDSLDRYAEGLHQPPSPAGDGPGPAPVTALPVAEPTP